MVQQTQKNYHRIRRINQRLILLTKFCKEHTEHLALSHDEGIGEMERMEARATQEAVIQVGEYLEEILNMDAEELDNNLINN